jgi:large repetitive protein
MSGKRTKRIAGPAKRAIVVVALLGVLGVATGLALAKSGPAAPTITSHPANPTTATSASFTFTDSQAHVTFVCSLDGSSFSACSSPKAYSGLAEGSHTFRVEAKDTSGNTSDPASFSWTIDLTPPSSAITFPAKGGLYSASGWSAGCAGGAGVCGTASDASGVSAVVVSIEQNATGKYWNGSGYSSSIELYNNATRSTTAAGANWRYALPLPSPDGSYTLHVRATDGLGNQTPSGSPATSIFTIDTLPPPAPSITAKPANPTNQTSASFGFTDIQADVSYLCRLDSGAYIACNSPKTYSGLAQGTHTFSVEAKDAAGNISSATSYTWVVDTTPPPTPTITGHPSNPTTSTTATFSFTDSEAGVSFRCKLDSGTWTACTSPTNYTGMSANNSHEFSVRAVDAAGNQGGEADFFWKISASANFTISGSPLGLLYPGGAALPIPVTLTNPDDSDLYVTVLTVSVNTATLPSGCNGSWFTFVQPNVSSTNTVRIPQHGSVTLPAQGVFAPTIQLIDAPVNQNACKNVKLSLTYSGSAHS